MDLNSIERIQEYSSLPCEKGVDVDKTLVDDANDETSSSGIELGSLDTSHHPLIASPQPPSAHHTVNNNNFDNKNHHSWPSAGCVEFKNIFLQYQSTKTPVLR